MDLTVLGALAVGLAAFSLLMAVFAPWLAVPARDDVVRAAGLPRERYERLVSAERPAWERLLAPVAGWVGRRVPALASQVSERDIVRAGLDPAALPPAEVYAAKLVLGVAILAVGLALSPFVPIALVAALPVAFAGYVFPTEYLGWLGRRRQGKLRRDLPDFLALVRPLAERHALERAVSDVADALHRATGGRNLLAEQVRAAVAAYGTGIDLYAALRDVAAAADLEELDELAGSLAQARHLGKGVGDVLAEHERGLREGERNRLVGAASTVQPKLAAILAGVYLPEFVLLIVVPLFLSTLGRL
jgi:Flp pilus assembly protein TadB